MKKVEDLAVTQPTFVVTAIFVTQMTVSANSEIEALEAAENLLIPKGATGDNLSNWHAHKV